jgi:hypothetical protein
MTSSPPADVSTTTLSTEAIPYIEAVRALLGALPADERDELVDDLTAHLAELDAEDGSPLRDRLGPPTQYAHEFVTSAGVVVHEPIARARLRDTVQLPPAVRTRLDAFRPSWLVLRPFLIVLGGASVLNDHLFGDVGAVEIVALGLIAVATIGVSQRLVGAWDRVASVAAIVAGLALVGALSEGRQYIYVDNAGYGPPGVLARGDGSIVSNIWAYDRDGNAIDVFLFDQSGRPLDDAATDAYDDRTGDELHSELRTDADGAVVPNLYPRRQSRLRYDDHGRPTQREDRPPAYVTPRLAPETTTTTSTTSSTAPPTTTTTAAQPQP